MINLFSRYISVGFLNTFLHWSVFYGLIILTSLDQSISNTIAFSIAVTFSFLINAKITFKSNISWLRYISYFFFMGLISFTIGAIADKLKLYPLITLIAFSSISLILGFLFSKYIVFKQTT